MRTVLSATESSNISSVQPSGFYLVGFSNLKNSEYLLVFLFLVYVITLLGNFILMAVVYLHPQLHTPRYMAVFNLAVVDVLHNTTLIPRTLQAFLFNSNYIGFNACFNQTFFAHYFASMESLTLVIMAYDRFVAICFPLRYPSINTNTKMFIIIASCWLGLIPPFLYMVLLGARSPFCKSVEIQSFFCSHGPTLRLACADISLNIRYGQIISITLSYGPLAFIFLTYVAVFTAVIKLDSAVSRRKPISTCVTHLILVLIFYVPLMVNYMLTQLSFSYSHDIRSVSIALASTLPPMLNPIIYSFNTEEVQGFISRVFKKWIIFPM
ncbi:olfactory receptor 6N1-like [Latimeria chalumnae]|uniref:olfactory receptor 6N1-like n=1 Tax=Latimeria chalumnae TaxID=7897 RepID=UPI0003C1B08A|nr:PREDICTED: olfactory receptor 6N1-like [Latimeria chalumnae]|eukprot:XP_006014511.1 PREDICTED: olfactory receptor 6N1-like [Latimeria chalumnae]